MVLGRSRLKVGPGGNAGSGMVVRTRVWNSPPPPEGASGHVHSSVTVSDCSPGGANACVLLEDVVALHSNFLGMKGDMLSVCVGVSGGWTPWCAAFMCVVVLASVVVVCLRNGGFDGSFMLIGVPAHPMP